MCEADACNVGRPVRRANELARDLIDQSTVAIHRSGAMPDRSGRILTKMSCVSQSSEGNGEWRLWNSWRGARRSGSTRPAWRQSCGGTSSPWRIARQERGRPRRWWMRSSTSWNLLATRLRGSSRTPFLETCRRTHPMGRSGPGGPGSVESRLRFIGSRPRTRFAARSGRAFRLESFRRVRPSPGRALQRLDGAAASSTYRIKAGSVRQPPSGGT